MNSLIRRLYYEGEKSRWLVAPALVVGLALRLFNLGGRNTWYDEVSSILFAEKGLADIVKATAADTMPPLYYFLLHSWLLLGDNLWVARSLSVILSLGMVAVAFAIARRLFGPRVAFVAALLVALNPFQVYHGQEVRMYSLLGLSQLLAIYFLLRCLDRSSIGTWTGFVLSQTVAMYTHNAAFLSLVTLDVLALGVASAFYLRPVDQDSPRPPAPRPEDPWLVRPARLSDETNLVTGLACHFSGRVAGFLKSLLLANLAVVVLFLPWLVYLPGQLAKVTRAFWTEMPGMAEFIRSIVVFTFNLPSPTPWSLPIFLAVSLLLFALMAYSVGRALLAGGKRARGDKGERMKETDQCHPSRFCSFPPFPLVFAVVCFLVPIVLAVLVSLIRPIYVERVLITPSVVYLILLAWMGERLRPRVMAPVLFVPVVLLSAWSLLSYYEYDGFPRVDFPRVVAYLEESYRPGDVIVHDNKLTFFPAYYLRRELPQQFLADPEWSINDTFAGQTQDVLDLRASSLAEAVEGKSRVWFVVFDRSLTEAREQGRANENMDWLSKRLWLASKQEFGNLSVYLYAR